MNRPHQYHLENLPSNASNEDILQTLNELGAKGWKLVFVEYKDLDSLRGWFIRERE